MHARIMGILNVTPDSFFDGGRFTDPATAIERGRQMLREGAEIIDVGGESTRPGADPVPIDLECERVCAVVEALAGDCIVSIDTRHEAVARSAVAVGARWVNDISATLAPMAAELNVGWIAMHMQGIPSTMQNAPHYTDVVAEVQMFLHTRAGQAETLGVPEIMIDPGIGFGKTAEHNLTLIDALEELTRMPYPVIVGASRKSFIGQVLGLPDPADRLIGSLTVAAIAAARGAAVIRTHDVAPTVQAIRMAAAVCSRSAENSPRLATIFARG
ncbi:dihydropteroate synthase [Nocardia higoensis]|uniref:dihydropteroate synthase n=1 Tax=Nocardia higoensis TaxID=228599 RepID=UPI001C3F3765|nr:dihydropteroate synthase [Nocardia higoensis]